MDGVVVCRCGNTAVHGVVHPSTTPPTGVFEALLVISTVTVAVTVTVTVATVNRSGFGISVIVAGGWVSALGPRKSGTFV
jgi:hypothetical protein